MQLAWVIKQQILCRDVTAIFESPSPVIVGNIAIALSWRVPKTPSGRATVSGLILNESEQPDYVLCQYRSNFPQKCRLNFPHFVN
jgi:hypothetical protein